MNFDFFGTSKGRGLDHLGHRFAISEGQIGAGVENRLIKRQNGLFRFKRNRVDAVWIHVDWHDMDFRDGNARSNIVVDMLESDTRFLAQVLAVAIYIADARQGSQRVDVFLDNPQGNLQFLQAGPGGVLGRLNEFFAGCFIFEFGAAFHRIDQRQRNCDDHTPIWQKPPHRRPSNITRPELMPVIF
jgi:hypothetical protein